MWLHCLCFIFVNTCLLCVCVFHIFNSQNTIDSQCIWLLLHILTYVIFIWYVTPPCHMWPFNCMHIYNMYYAIRTYLLFTAALVLSFIPVCRVKRHIWYNKSGELQPIPECTVFYICFLHTLHWNCCLPTNTFGFS